MPDAFLWFNQYSQDGIEDGLMLKMDKERLKKKLHEIMDEMCMAVIQKGSYTEDISMEYQRKADELIDNEYNSM